jgi:hypothetical protein
MLKIGYSFGQRSNVSRTTAFVESGGRQRAKLFHFSTGSVHCRIRRFWRGSASYFAEQAANQLLKLTLYLLWSFNLPCKRLRYEPRKISRKSIA